MKITINIDTPENSGPESYYRALAEMLGRHVSELVSLGNMEVTFVASIYRKIAAEIEDGRLDLPSLSRTEGAAAVKEGFLEAVGTEGNAEESETKIRVEWRGSEQFDAVEKFWDKVRNIPEIDRINDTESLHSDDIASLSSDALSKDFAMNLSNMAKLVAKAVGKVEALAEEFGIKIVEDRSAFIVENEGYVGAERYGRRTAPSAEGIPVVGWGDIIDLNIGYRLEKVVKKAVLDRNSNAYATIFEAVSLLPIFVRGSARDDMRQNISHNPAVFDQIRDFDKWVEAEIGKGLARAVVDKKIQSDFPLIVPYAYHFMNGIEFMFPDRKVVRRQTGGRLTFWWKDV